ncbi:MAG: hypothetical protein ACXW32_15180 [Limisphaerales bacterium]
MDPIFEGKKLSAHLSAAYAPAIMPEAPMRIPVVVEKLGTNAVPLLIEWLETSPNKYVERAQEFGAKYLGLNRPVYKGRAAAQASAYLGTNGAAMLQPLTLQLTHADPFLAYFCAHALETLCDKTRMDESTLIAMLQQKTNLATLAHPPSAQNLRQGIESALARAIESYDDGGSYRHLMVVRSGGAEWRRSARVLSRRKKYAEEIIPFLERDLEASELPELENGIRALGNYGPAGRGSAEKVRPFLSHTNETIRSAAKQAMAMMSAGEASK